MFGIDDLCEVIPVLLWFTPDGCQERPVFRLEAAFQVANFGLDGPNLFVNGRDFLIENPPRQNRCRPDRI